MANSPARQGTRFIKNLFSGTDDHTKDFNSIFNKLMQEFRDSAVGDTLVIVHRIWEHLEALHEYNVAWFSIVQPCSARFR